MRGELWRAGSWAHCRWGHSSEHRVHVWAGVGPSLGGLPGPANRRRLDHPCFPPECWSFSPARGPLERPVEARQLPVDWHHPRRVLGGDGHSPLGLTQARVGGEGLHKLGHLQNPQEGHLSAVGTEWTVSTWLEIVKLVTKAI